MMDLTPPKLGAGCIGMEIRWLLNSSNVQPDTESPLMINNCSHGIYFLRFLFSCKKTRALACACYIHSFRGVTNTIHHRV